MAVRFEWQTYPNGRRRYVRIVDDTPDAPKVPSKRTRVVGKVAAAPKKRGRPPKAKPAETPAPVVVEDASDE